MTCSVEPCATSRTPYFQSSTYRGVECDTLQMIAGSCFAPTFQSSTYRGVECDTTFIKWDLPLFYTFSPLLIEEWSVTQHHGGTLAPSLAFSPLLIEEWSVTRPC